MAAQLPSEAPQTQRFPLYPELPQPGSALIPLPRIMGPKLKPFDFQGPQQIEFLEHLGEGAHSHVIKVKILGQEYALKLFMFQDKEEYLNTSISVDDQNREEVTAFYEYLDPFNCECRAFGRLQESGHPELAVDCFGYVLLDEHHERALRDRFPGDKLEDIFQDDRSRDCRWEFLTKDGRQPPIRGIVKEFGKPTDKLRNRHMSKIRQDVIQMQQLGIIAIDVADRQLINGKHCDFSKAMTTPHFAINTELHSQLYPEELALIEYELFLHCLDDYIEFDDMILEWNEEHRLQKDQVSVRAIPQLYGSWRWTYNLRRTASRDRVFTYVDPRLYDWRAPARGGDQNPAEKRANGRSSKGSTSARSVAKVSKTCRRFKKPPRWYYEGSKEYMAGVRRPRGFQAPIIWTFKQGIFIPRKRTR